MLIVSLLLSAALLIVANLVARRSGRLATPCVICGLGIFVGWPCAMFPALMLTGAVTALCGPLCRVLGGGPPLFLKCSLAAVLASHLLVGILSYPRIQERRTLNAQFPTESLAQRLSYETRRTQPGSVALAERDRQPTVTDGQVSHRNPVVADLELRLDSGSNLRDFSLARLHADSVTDFINSPGFGITRSMEPRKEYIDLPEIEPIDLPPPPISAAVADSPSLANPDTIPSLAAQENLRDMHQESIVDFVNPKGFGFIKDREHVRGFQAHHFRTMPHVKSLEMQRWRI